MESVIAQRMKGIFFSEYIRTNTKLPVSAFMVPTETDIGAAATCVSETIVDDETDVCAITEAIVEDETDDGVISIVDDETDVCVITAAAAMLTKAIAEHESDTGAAHVTAVSESIVEDETDVCAITETIVEDETDNGVSHTAAAKLHMQRIDNETAVDAANVGAEAHFTNSEIETHLPLERGEHLFELEFELIKNFDYLVSTQCTALFLY